MTCCRIAFVLTTLPFALLGTPPAAADLTIHDLGHDYVPDPDRVSPGLSHPVADRDVNHGNTSIRNNTEQSLRWKSGPNANGEGYYQRNRDLGQVFVVDYKQPVTLDALVLRTSLGSYGVLPGAPCAPMYVQFFRVDPDPESPLTINDNGTPLGTPASHGFDTRLSRADDYIQGARYTPLHRATGGVFPCNIPPTSQPGHPKADPGVTWGPQPGHLRYLRFDFRNDSELTLLPGQRYAFLVGFETPGNDRCIALSVTTRTHHQANPTFVTDPHGQTRWGIRREGHGPRVPTIVIADAPPSNPVTRQALIDEATFTDHHWNTQPPTSRGFPDVDTYRTLEFYIECYPNP
ncbi:MAG: hypothetical protein AAFX76_07500 [Planctomycetota bacterium]